MRNGTICAVAFVAVLMLLPMPMASGEGQYLSGHAQDDIVDVTYQDSAKGAFMYLSFAQTPTSDIKLLIISSNDRQTVERLPGERHLTVELRPLLQQTYTVLAVNFLTSEDIALIDIEIGYNSTYKITLKSGEGSGSDIVEEIIAGGTYLFPACTFTAPAGKVFGSWSVSGRSYAPEDAIKVNGDMTVTAQWREPVERIISFSPGTGSGSMEPMKVMEGQPCVLPKCTFTAPAGYSFSAWKVGDEIYSAGQSFIVTDDVTATALWTESSGEDNSMLFIIIGLVIAILVLMLIVFFVVRRKF